METKSLIWLVVLWKGPIGKGYRATGCSRFIPMFRPWVLPTVPPVMWEVTLQVVM